MGGDVTHTRSCDTVSIMRAKKSLGQHFLTSDAIARDIVAAANLKRDDIALEVGPGKGFLTGHLLRAAGKIIAVEADTRMVKYLKDKFAKELRIGKLELVHQDILSFDPTSYRLPDTGYKLVANIPYYITGEILRKFLGGEPQPSRMALLVQKEVAERIVAFGGKESILSLSIKAYGAPRIAGYVPARFFTPQPDVDSAILAVEDISRERFKTGVEESRFFRALKQGFSHKRKMLRGNLLREYPEDRVTKMFKACAVVPSTRAEELSLAQWFCAGRILEEEGALA